MTVVEFEQPDAVHARIVAAIEDARRRGWKNAVIGALVAGDVSFVSRVLSRAVKMRPSTLSTAASRLHLIAGDPPSNSRTRGFLAS